MRFRELKISGNVLIMCTKKGEKGEYMAIIIFSVRMSEQSVWLFVAHIVMEWRSVCCNEIQYNVRLPLLWQASCTQHHHYVHKRKG